MNNKLFWRIKLKDSKIQLLDCTLRDGGQGLETAYSIGISEVQFWE